LSGWTYFWGIPIIAAVIPCIIVFLLSRISKKKVSLEELNFAIDLPINHKYLKEMA